MDNRAAKLALARKKLKDHQDKKTVQKDDTKADIELQLQPDITIAPKLGSNNNEFIVTHNDDIVSSHNATHIENQNSVGTDIYIREHSSNPSVDINGDHNKSVPVPDVNVTEILITSKRNLELQVQNLQTKLSHLEHNHALVINDLKVYNQKVSDLQNELQHVNNKFLNAVQEMQMKDTMINELNSRKLSMSDEKNNLLEQLEFTKAVLNNKEAENDSLNSKLYNLQNQYDVLQVQLQQLTNGSLTGPLIEKTVDMEKNQEMVQKIASLEQQLSLLHKERDQMNIHYEHYVTELNEQLREAIKKNESLNKEVQNLSNRENSLIEQISDMEIRIQNYNIDKKRFEMDHNATNVNALEDKLKEVQVNFDLLQTKHNQLLSELAASEAKVKDLSDMKESECNHDNISISKLSADMTSDKVAAQRATEQNKKLKQDMQGLEDAFVKMSKDKLELTEKLTAEKFLNRELTIKLAEVEEKSKEMQIKLKAKDEEMIRLQSNCREIMDQFEKFKASDINNLTSVREDIGGSCEEQHENHVHELDSCCEAEHAHLIEEVVENNGLGLQKEDAMSKLQERFLKIMGEVADLSDEKHRLEHIILQLQNETDTICEYVALYQQQRSLLKRRDEERSAQLKVFQQECGKLKCELEELSGILARFADDQDLLAYFQDESKRIDIERVMALLQNLKNNSLIDPKKKNVEFKNFYPCNCCSGKLIEV